MGGGGRQSEGSTADTARKRPERPWTAAKTMEVLRRCPLAIAQRLVHCAIAVSTAGQSVAVSAAGQSIAVSAAGQSIAVSTAGQSIAVSAAGQSHKDNVRCTAVEEQPEAKAVQLWRPCSTSLLMISSGLT